MTSLRQIEANRRNARLSTGPVTDDGKRRSRQNAVRHGLTAETVINALEDAEDYASFELTVTADYDAATAVERELVLRLASLLWRLRRATAIESGLFKMQAKQLLDFQQRRRAREDRQENIQPIYPDAIITDDASRSDDPYDNLTRSYLQLADLPTYPLDRLSRYECALWRQARQILRSLRTRSRRGPAEWAGFGNRHPW
jgi:hypothetical protein